ncbi:PQQ-binding-like beta-propeller repeat protein [Sinorhizobium meliloti]|nr:PQQ-binding-like beta-propeller repeat protein [Sinorhizobium meliloti]
MGTGTNSLASWLAVLINLLLRILSGAQSAVAQSSDIAYVTSESAGAISGIDTHSNRIVWRADIPGRPHNLEVTTDGLVVVATQGIDAVSIVDATSGVAEIKRVAIGVPPHDIALDSDGRTVFVVSERGLLLRLDPLTGRILERLKLRGTPHNLFRQGKVVWITDVSARRIFSADRGRVRELPISVQGHDLAIRPGSRELWVTPWRSNLTVIVDLESHQEIAKLEVGQTASHKHLAFTPDGGQAWITEPESGSLLVVDAGSRQNVARIGLGGPPHHLRFAEGKAYVAVGPRELVSVDVGTRKIIGRVPVSSGVHDVAFRPLSDK